MKELLIRRCLPANSSIFGCPAYTESTTQIHNNALNARARASGVPFDPDEFKNGTCNVLGSEVTRGAECGIGTPRFMLWLARQKPIQESRD